MKLEEKTRRELVRWGVGVALVALVVGVIGALGGFAEATAPRRFVDTGVEQDLGRWRLSVDSAELLDRDPEKGYKFQQPKVRVHVTVTNLSDEPLFGVTESVIAVTLPNGERPDMFGVSTYAIDHEGDFDPGVTSKAYIQLEPKEPLWIGDQPILVKLAHEVHDDGSFVYRDRYRPAYLVGAVRVLCEDKRG